MTRIASVGAVAATVGGYALGSHDTGAAALRWLLELVAAGIAGVATIAVLVLLVTSNLRNQ